jgi:hypothetical protein
MIKFFSVIATVIIAGWPQVSRAQLSIAKNATILPRGASLLHKNSDGTAGTFIFDPALTDQFFSANPSDSDVQNATRSFLIRSADSLLHVPASASLTAHGTSHVGIVWHSTFGISYQGIPVVDRKVSIVIGALSRKPMMLESNLPTLEPNSIEASFSAPSAAVKMLDYVQAHLAVSCEVSKAPSMIFTVAGESQSLLLAYEGLVRDHSGAHLWRVRLDALTGEVLDVRDVYESLSGHDDPLGTASGTLTALINPQSSYDTAISMPMPFENIFVNGKGMITDSLGRWSVSSVSPPYIITSTFDGPFNHAVRKDGLNGALNFTTSETPIQVQWTNANSNPAERDAFHSVNFARNYVRKVDTALITLDRPLTINVNLNQTCNAYYDPNSVSVNFFKAGGQNCANTGEITDVVFHEFGHRVTDARYTQNGGLNIVDGSLGEGFADCVSAFIRDDPRIGIGFFLKGSLLRNCDNTKRWPKDLNADIHVSGEIIAGAFWDLRKLIGHDTAEHLFHMMGYLNPDGIGSTAPGPMLDAFTSVLTAVITADDNDNDLTNGTPHLSQILKAFNKHNIGLSGLISISVDQIADQDSNLPSYRVSAVASYAGKIGILDANTVTLHYSVDGGKNYLTTLLSPKAGNLFAGQIPKVRPGSIIQYYASAHTNYVDAGEGISPTAVFLVGFKRVSFDDAEQDHGWSLSEPSDNATTGRWTRDVPFGTFTSPSDFVQQDTDHTPNGTYCFLTGNANKATQSRSTSLDDVDNGATTLTSPTLDLSALANPIIRYWYYYRNDAGSNPGLPKWATYISNDGGTSWKTVQNTNASANGWTAFLLPVSAFVVPSGNVLVRFVASDNVGAIVEAGVDDFEVLEGPKSELNAVAHASSASYSIGSIFPNPISSGALTIPFSVTKSEHVVMTVKDVLGRTLATPLDQFVERGSFTTSVALAQQAAGTYWVQLATSEGSAFSRFVIVR